MEKNHFAKTSFQNAFLCIDNPTANISGEHVSRHSRQLNICLFADEKSTTPIVNKSVSWAEALDIHSSRAIRATKSGGMIGAYNLRGTRRDDDVGTRSFLQLDIDTKGEKDKNTGRIIKPQQPAPSLADIRDTISKFEWFAASSHWHEPHRGVIKYRIGILTDRDIKQDEHLALLEALDERLGGILDRDAWQWSQPFFLPSCPDENMDYAFFVHNEGEALPVTQFVERGREIIAARAQAASGKPKTTQNCPVTLAETAANVERVKSILVAIDPDIERIKWRQVCWAVMSTRWPCAVDLIDEWSRRGSKFTDRDFNDVVRDFKPNGGTGFGTLVHIARQHGWNGALPQGAEGVTLNDFYAHMPSHQYIFAPTGELWPAASINARFGTIAEENEKPIPVNVWLDRNRAIEQMTWIPSEEQLITDRLTSNGGVIEHVGARCFNLYKAPPLFIQGNFKGAEPWLKHIELVYPNDCDHIVNFMAQRVQYPQIKINHALVLGGAQGVGKDTILQPVKEAIGPWNFEEASPHQLLGRFNGFAKSVILRVNEARDLGDLDRFEFYDRMKIYTASPPEMLRVDEKHTKEYYVLNCCGVIITTNYKTDGIYLPPDDRRHYIAWSDCSKDDFGVDYWNKLWSWYQSGGYAHVAAYLEHLDLSKFDPKAPPPKTSAFHDIVAANCAPEESELADIIEALGNPITLTLDRLKENAEFEFRGWLEDRRNRRATPHRLESCGYVRVRNPCASDGQWKIDGKRVNVYGRKDRSEDQRRLSAQRMTGAAPLDQWVK